MPPKCQVENLATFVQSVEVQAAKGIQTGLLIPNRVQTLKAPVVHKFAAGVSEITVEDVAKEVIKNRGVLEGVFSGCTPLDLAIANNSVGRLEALLGMGADPNNTRGIKIKDRHNEYEAHPIHTVIHFRRPKCLQLLLNAKASVVETYRDKPIMALQLALTRLDGTSVGTILSENVVEVLLGSREFKKAVDIPNKYGSTPLFQCILGLNKIFPKLCPDEEQRRDSALIKAVTMLITAGANPNTTNWQTPLLQYALKNDVDEKIINLLLEHGADPNGYSGSNGQTCLITAIKGCQIKVVEKLLELGADVNGTSPDGNKPLFAAYLLKDCTIWRQMVTTIIKQPEFRVGREIDGDTDTKKASMEMMAKEETYYSYRETDKVHEKSKNVSDKPTNSLILQLISGGELGKLRDYLATSTTANLDARNEARVSALHEATKRNDIDVVQLLLEKGSNLNIKDGEGNYALTFAAKNSNGLEILDALLSKGANIDARGALGKTALFEAALANRIENIEYLSNAQKANVSIGEVTNGSTPLHLMAQKNNIHALDILLKSANVNIHVLNTYGATPLHYAARTDSVEAATVLIRRGAFVNVKCTFRGNTPLHIAAYFNSLKVSKVLIEAGASINERNNFQETPLFLATFGGKDSMINFLLDKRADIDAKNVHGQTPLYNALNCYNIDCAKLLVHRGADIMSRDKNRDETILHLAVSIADEDFITFLTNRGADKEAKDKHGMTPLLRSATVTAKTADSTVKTLLQLGCNASATAGINNKNLLDFIIENKNLDALFDVVTICPKSKRRRLIYSLKALPKKSKDEVLNCLSDVIKHGPEIFQGD